MADSPTLSSLVEELAEALTESQVIEVPTAVYEAAQVRANEAYDALDDWLAGRGWVLELTPRGQVVARLLGADGLLVQVRVAKQVERRGRRRRWVASPDGVAQLAKLLDLAIT